MFESREQRREDLGVVDVGQPFVAAVQVIGHPAVVEAQQVEDRGVQVGDLDAVFDGVIAQLVGGAVSLAAFDAAAGQPQAEALLVVVAAIASLADRGPAEFASPDDERAVEQARGA